MMYGNSSMGFSYSPDRSKDTVNHDNLHTPFLGASGSRQTGYWYSPSRSNSTCSTYSNKPKGRYLGNGQYVED